MRKPDNENQSDGMRKSGLAGANAGVRWSAGEPYTRETCEINGMTVTIVRKPIKNMYLRIKPPNADIVVSAPARMPDGDIERFVMERGTWIQHARNVMLRARDEQIRRSVGIDGMENAGSSAGATEKSDDGSFDGSMGMGSLGSSGLTGSVSSDSRNDSFAWTAAMRAHARRNIEEQLPSLLAKWTPIIGRRPTHITLRVMTSRWGSCTPKTGRIRLNLQLGLMEPRFLEYVLVHEMTHLWEHGHGAGFQRRMTAYLPQWRQLRREINRQVVL